MLIFFLLKSEYKERKKLNIFIESPKNEVKRKKKIEQRLKKNSMRVLQPKLSFFSSSCRLPSSHILLDIYDQ